MKFPIWRSLLLGFAIVDLFVSLYLLTNSDPEKSDEIEIQIWIEASDIRRLVSSPSLYSIRKSKRFLLCGIGSTKDCSNRDRLFVLESEDLSAN